MKTSTNRALSAQQSLGIRVLEWSDAVVSSSCGLPIPNRAKLPALRIVSTEREDLFKRAIGANARTGFWEAIVFTIMALSAAGALAVAFLGI